MPECFDVCLELSITRESELSALHNDLAAEESVFIIQFTHGPGIPRLKRRCVNQLDTPKSNTSNANIFCQLANSAFRILPRLNHCLLFRKFASFWITHCT